MVSFFRKNSVTNSSKSDSKQMKSFIILLTALIAGCASVKRDATPPIASLADGNWAGTFVRKSTDRVKEFEPSTVHLSVCRGQARLWFKDGDKYDSVAAIFHSTSAQRNHLIYAVQESDNQPGFVEFHSMIMVEIDENTARAQFSRVVSNTDVADDQPNRTFFQHGFGELRRLNRECNMKLITLVKP